MTTCAIPECGDPWAPDLSDPICVKHATRIYLEVKRKAGNATTQQRLEAIGRGRGTAVGRRGLGHVYFFDMGQGVVKIGWSSDYKQRARDLGARAVLGCFVGTLRDEKAMHARFGYCWRDGEYFDAHPDLISYARSLGEAA